MGEDGVRQLAVRAQSRGPDVDKGRPPNLGCFVSCLDAMIEVEWKERGARTMAGSLGPISFRRARGATKGARAETCRYGIRKKAFASNPSACAELIALVLRSLLLAGPSHDVVAAPSRPSSGRLSDNSPSVSRDEDAI